MELIVDMAVYLKEELESQAMLEVIMVMKKIIMEKEKLCLDMPILFLSYGLKPFINLYGGVEIFYFEIKDVEIPT